MDNISCTMAHKCCHTVIQNHFTNPKCEHFLHCGGCKSQHIDYLEQLNQKKNQVQDIFQKNAGIKNFNVDQVVPASPIFNYRNKMEFTFSESRTKKVFHIKPIKVK